jgi:hypothetical protein
MLQIETVKLLRGTELRRLARSEGWPFDRRAPYSIQATPWMSASEIRRGEAIARAIDRLRNRWYLRPFADAAAARTGDAARFWEVFCDWWHSDPTYRRADLPAQDRFNLFYRFLRTACADHGWDSFLLDDLRFAYCSFERPVEAVVPRTRDDTPLTPEAVQEGMDTARLTLVPVPRQEPDAVLLSPRQPPRPLTADRKRCCVEAFDCDCAARLAHPAASIEARHATFVFVYPRPDDSFRRPLVFKARRTSSI